MSYGIGATVLNQAANGTCSFGGSCVYQNCELGTESNARTASQNVVHD